MKRKLIIPVGVLVVLAAVVVGKRQEVDSARDRIAVPVERGEFAVKVRAKGEVAGRRGDPEGHGPPPPRCRGLRARRPRGIAAPRTGNPAHLQHRHGLHRGHLAAGGRDRHHEHHACDRDRADQGDWHSSRGRRLPGRHPEAVSHRSDGISVAGGLLGIGLGWSIGEIIAFWAKWTTVASVQAMALGFGVSATVGIVFGSYPAWRAALQDPISALRYE